jgi:hypothetical protein
VLTVKRFIRTLSVKSLIKFESITEGMISGAGEREREGRLRVIFGGFFGNFDGVRRYKRSRNIMNIESAKSVIFIEAIRVSALVDDISGELLEGVVEGSGEHVVENELRGESGHV